MAVVVCAGLIAVDFLFDLSAFPEAGTKSRARESRTLPGGGALNAAMAVAALGGEAVLAGALGDDALGGMLREALAKAGVDDSLVETRTGVPTARSAVLMSPGGERTVVNHRDPRLFVGPSRALPDGVGAVLADTRWPRGAADLFTAAAGRGMPAVIDAEAPVRHAEEALHLATHVAFSEQGLADYADGASSVASLRKAAHDLGAWVALTRGPRPILVYDGRQESELPAFPVRAADTLGAGDVWHGAFALGLAEGRGEAEAALRANAAAAIHVSRRAGDPRPTRGEVDSMIAKSD